MRRGALLKAARSGAPALSDKVVLVQDAQDALLIGAACGLVLDLGSLPSPPQTACFCLPLLVCRMADLRRTARAAAFAGLYFLCVLVWGGEHAGWTLGVLAEITAFWWMPRLLGRCTLVQLLRWGLLMAVLRFGVMASLPDLPVAVIAMQLLHAFTFATHHTASIGLIHQAVPAEHQAKGQGLYWVLGYGLGGGIGGLAAGALWPYGEMAAAFGLSALAAAVGWLLMWRWPSSAPPAV
mgnify:CR=1 FL=1